ncbi:MAG: zinc ribbon domain-containing protein [Desulfatiglandales bacterium]
MFFFIAGIQPKKVVLQDEHRVCPSCGQYSLRLERMDHYLSLFFVPLFRVKKGEPFWACQRCGLVSGESGEVLRISAKEGRPVCPHCGRSLEHAYRFCPYCGNRLRS